MVTEPNHWDTFAFFEEVMNSFAGYMASSHGSLAASQDSYQRGVAAGKHGYAISGVIQSSWSEEQEELLRRYLTGDYSIEALDWYEECAEPIQVFACVVFGALLSKIEAGQITANDYYLAEAHLPAFIMQENERICAIYERGNSLDVS